jgi:hypothetical protein
VRWAAAAAAGAGLSTGERKLPTERPQAMLSAKDLPRCELSDHLEQRLERTLQVGGAEREGRQGGEVGKGRG